jgi:hypothetical protein
VWFPEEHVEAGSHRPMFALLLLHCPRLASLHIHVPSQDPYLAAGRASRLRKWHFSISGDSGWQARSQKSKDLSVDSGCKHQSTLTKNSRHFVCLDWRISRSLMHSLVVNLGPSHKKAVSSPTSQSLSTPP